MTLSRKRYEPKSCTIFIKILLFYVSIAKLLDIRHGINERIMK